GADVDEPDAADLDVVLRQLVAAADQQVIAATRDVDDVVRDQAVAALHQVEHAFALAYSRLTEEQQHHAEHVGERGVHAGGRREPLGVAGEHQAGGGGFRRRDLAVELDVSRQCLELQGIAPLLEQVAHLGLFHDGRRRARDLSSWRRTLAAARFSALPWSAPRAVPTCSTPRAAWSRTSTAGRPWSASNTTRASCGRGATRARRWTSARARACSS